MIGKYAYPVVMGGDIFSGFEVLTSCPVKPNDKMVQRVLDEYDEGWGDWRKDAASELMGYTVH